MARAANPQPQGGANLYRAIREAKKKKGGEVNKLIPGMHKEINRDLHEYGSKGNNTPFSREQTLILPYFIEISLITSQLIPLMLIHRTVDHSGLYKACKRLSGRGSVRNMATDPKHTLIVGSEQASKTYRHLDPLQKLAVVHVLPLCVLLLAHVHHGYINSVLLATENKVDGQTTPTY